MKLPQLPTLPEAKERAVTWAARHLYAILGVAGAVIVVSLVVLFLVLRGMEKDVIRNPPLSRKAAKVLVRKEKQAAATADSAKRQAVAHDKRADSAERVAEVKIKQADSLKTTYENLPASSDAAISDLQRRWADYKSPFRPQP